MKAPRFAVVSIALDTQAYRSIRPEVREHKIAYLLNRLLSGEEIDQQALEHQGLKVTIRDAVAPEIVSRS
jgi:hypothetical protein